MTATASDRDETLKAAVRAYVAGHDGSATGETAGYAVGALVASALAEGDGDAGDERAARAAVSIMRYLGWMEPAVSAALEAIGQGNGGCDGCGSADATGDDGLCGDCRADEARLAATE